MKNTLKKRHHARMLSKTIDVDGLKAFWREGGRCCE
jgi:hypothetical protein